MLKARRGAALLILTLAAVTFGCASAGTSRAIGPGDLPSLAGTWSGTITPPSTGGGAMNSQGTLTLSPNGDYVARAGAFTAQGKAQVKDGALVMTSTSTTGGLSTGTRTSTATLSDR